MTTERSDMMASAVFRLGRAVERLRDAEWSVEEHIETIVERADDLMLDLAVCLSLIDRSDDPGISDEALEAMLTPAEDDYLDDLDDEELVNCVGREVGEVDEDRLLLASGSEDAVERLRELLDLIERIEEEDLSPEEAETEFAELIGGLDLE